MSAFARRGTMLEDVQYTPYAHKYLIKRPVVAKSVPGSTAISLQNTLSNSDAWGSTSREGEGLGDGQGIDNHMVEKRRFELFIDLIWVGIIGNLADNYSEQAFTEESTSSTGQAVAEFFVLFLMAWRMWRNLEEFMTKYHTHDIIENSFVIWILILATLFGNNARFILDDSKQAASITAIIIYLISKLSFVLIETAYSIFLPFERKGILLRLAFNLPSIGVWIGAIMVTNVETRASLLTVGVVMDFFAGSFYDNPLMERWLPTERAQGFDADHWVQRMQDFFIIILGEGVLNLIRGTPLGKGLSWKSGLGIVTMVQYYLISRLYFNGDQSRKYIHAVKRSYWRKQAWIVAHTVMYWSTLTLGVSNNFLIQHPTSDALLPHDEEDTHLTELADFTHKAKWSVSIALAVTLICLSIIALLCRSLDKPGSLKVTNRYIRLLPRLIVLIVAVCLPIQEVMLAIDFQGILVALLASCLVWEWIASLERSGGIIER